jgi:preprotein translocase subunit YajC
MTSLIDAALLAQGTAPNPKAQNLYLFLVILTMGFMFYFAIWRPQQKRAREQEALTKSLKQGDKVVTSSGIVGVIVGIREKTVAIRSADAKFEVLKSAVSEVIERSEGPAQS